MSDSYRRRIRASALLWPAFNGTSPATALSSGIVRPTAYPGDEGTFTLCSFWLANALALAGQLDEAQALFEHVLGQANDLGLLAEEIDPAASEQLGNFPQAFSHMALIGAAVDLASAAQHGAERTPQTEAERAHRCLAAPTSGI